MSATIRCLAFLTALAVGAPARADAPIVGVVSGERGQPIARRLEAELRARGYRVRSVELPIRAETFSELEGLDASAWVDDAPPRVRVCVLGSSRPCEALTDPDVTVVLIRAVESIRAQLDAPMREPASPPAPSEPARPPAPPTSPAVIPEHRWALMVEATLIVPTSSLSTAAGAQVVLSWSPDPWLELQLGGLATLLAPEVADARGTAVVDARIAWIGGSLRIPEALLAGHVLLLGGAAGISSVDLRATATPPFEARSSSMTGAVLLAHATLVVRVIDRLELVVGLRAGSVLPQPVIVFEDREVARWGAPFVGIEVGAAADLSGAAQ